jgi:hypothetical protein
MAPRPGNVGFAALVLALWVCVATAADATETIAATVVRRRRGLEGHHQQLDGPSS